MVRIPKILLEFKFIIKLLLGRKITETKCSVDTVVAAEFHPLDRNQIITIGKSHVAFWTLDQNGALYKKMGVFDSREKPKYVTCCKKL